MSLSPKTKTEAEANIFFALLNQYFDNNNLNARNGIDYTVTLEGDKAIIGLWNEGKLGARPVFNDSDKHKALINLMCNDKIKQLYNYYKSNIELSILTINTNYKISLKKEDRDLILEQIENLKLEIENGTKVEADASFDYYDDAKPLSISYAQLKTLYSIMINISNTNFKVYNEHMNNIKALTSENELNNYDFTTNFLKNQSITLN